MQLIKTINVYKTKPNEAKAWFGRLLRSPAMKRIGPYSTAPVAHTVAWTS